MIKFDASKLHVYLYEVKSVSTALGGSMTVVDEEATAAEGVEQTYRLPVPYAVARTFSKTYKITKYLKPVTVAALVYDGHVICLERHPLAAIGAVSNEVGEVWKPFIQLQINRYVLPEISKGTWYFDGRYVYKFADDDVESLLDGAQRLNAAGTFRRLTVSSYDLMINTSLLQAIEQQERDCVAFVASSGKYSISPPIWKNVLAVGMSSSRGEQDDDDDDNAELALDEGLVKNAAANPFDDVNSRKYVNLGFVLRAGQEISKLFSYETVEPLQLPRLMVELRTVNLPALPKSLKRTYNVQTSFQTMLAWLLGLQLKVNTLDTQLILRSLIKHLSGRGIVNHRTLTTEAIYVSGEHTEDIPLYNYQDLVERARDDLELSAILSRARKAQKLTKG